MNHLIIGLNFSQQNDWDLQKCWKIGTAAHLSPVEVNYLGNILRITEQLEHFNNQLTTNAQLPNYKPKLIIYAVS